MTTMTEPIAMPSQVEDDNPTYDLGWVSGSMWVYELLCDFVLADEIGADIHDLHAYIDYRLSVRLTGLNER